SSSSSDELDDLPPTVYLSSYVRVTRPLKSLLESPLSIAAPIRDWIAGSFNELLLENCVSSAINPLTALSILLEQSSASSIVSAQNFSVLTEAGCWNSS